MYLFSSHLYRFKMHQLILLALFLPFSVAVALVSLDRRAEVLLEKVNIFTFTVDNHIPQKESQNARTECGNFVFGCC